MFIQVEILKEIKDAIVNYLNFLKVSLDIQYKVEI